MFEARLADLRAAGFRPSLPRHRDICYATQERQDAVRALAAEVDENGDDIGPDALAFGPDRRPFGQRLPRRGLVQRVLDVDRRRVNRHDADEAVAERRVDPGVGQHGVHLRHGGEGEVREAAAVRRREHARPLVVGDEDVHARHGGARRLGGRGGRAHGIARDDLVDAARVPGEPLEELDEKPLVAAVDDRRRRHVIHVGNEGGRAERGELARAHAEGERLARRAGDVDRVARLQRRRKGERRREGKEKGEGFHGLSAHRQGGLTRSRRRSPSGGAGRGSSACSASRTRRRPRWAATSARPAASPSARRT